MMGITTLMSNKLMFLEKNCQKETFFLERDYYIPNFSFKNKNVAKFW
jgi:hypothetical protein